MKNKGYTKLTVNDYKIDIDGERFTLKYSYSVYLGDKFNCTDRIQHFCTDKGQVLATLYKGLLTIYKGYHWDGYSPSVRFFGKWIGTPIPNNDLTPSLIHDFLRLFRGVENCLWERKDTDLFFKELLIKGGCKKWISNLYYTMVSGFFGTLYMKVNHKTQEEKKVWIRNVWFQ